MNKGLIASALAIAVVAGPAAATAAAEDWPGYGGGGGQNWSASSEPGMELGTRWESSTRTPTGGCVVAHGDSVYTTAKLEENVNEARVLRVDAATGAVRWRSAPFADWSWADPPCPAVDGERVYLSRIGDVTAYDAADGSIDWTWDGPETVSGPAVSGGTVFVSVRDPDIPLGDALYALDASDGSVRWDAGDEWGELRPPLVLGSTVLHSRRPLWFPAIHAVADGATLWTPVGAFEWTGHDGVYAIAADPGTGSELSLRDAVTGAVAWRRALPAGQRVASIVLDAERVYVRLSQGDVAGRVAAYSRASGEPLWNVASVDSHDEQLARLGSRLISIGGASYDPATGVSEPLPGNWWQLVHETVAYADSTFYAWRHRDGALVLAAFGDVTAPQLDVVAPAADAATRARRPDFRWTVADGRGSGVAGVELKLGDGAPVALGTAGGSWQPAADLADGTYAWQLSARDAAGNVTRSDERQLTVDTAAPDAFALSGPTGTVADARPALSWQRSQDATSGVAQYRVAVDGAVVATAGPDACGADGCSARPDAPLADGARTWSVTAVDRAGNERTAGGGSFTVAAPPAGTLSAATSVGYAGTLVELTAAFADPNDAIASYAWDLDGDGSFERTTDGATPRAQARLEGVGTRTYRVKATDGGGLATVATVDVEARLAPPGGELGFSINGGAVATNSRQVELTVSWPARVTHAVVSNDGGFGAAGSTAQLPIARTIRWTLASSGPERLPKTVYLRFRGGDGGRETYTDDIILDETVPLLDALSASTAGRAATAAAASVAPKVATAAARKRTRTFRVRARDTGSGVVAVQVSARRSAKGAVTKRVVRKNARGPRRWNGKVTVRAPSGRVWVRVLDAAGNGSKWRRTAR